MGEKKITHTQHTGSVCDSLFCFDVRWGCFFSGCSYSVHGIHKERWQLSHAHHPCRILCNIMEIIIFPTNTRKQKIKASHKHKAQTIDKRWKIIRENPELKKANKRDASHNAPRTQNETLKIMALDFASHLHLATTTTAMMTMTTAAAATKQKWRNEMETI